MKDSVVHAEVTEQTLNQPGERRVPSSGLSDEGREVDRKSRAWTVGLTLGLAG